MNDNIYLVSKNLRKQECDEIFIDIDDRSEHGSRCVSAVGLALYNTGYWFELWFAPGMKQPHIRIPKVFVLTHLSKEENKEYRRAFYKKYITKEFWQETINDDRKKIPDLSLCDPYEDKFHPVPKQGMPHHKYKTLYLKVAEFNNDGRSWNFTEAELYNAVFNLNLENENQNVTYESKKTNYNSLKKYLFQKIAAKISIIDIADKFGLLPKGKPKRTCPFHNDGKPSLSLNDELGIFNCLGCHTSGNIIKFYALLKQIDPKFKYVLDKPK